MLAQAAHDRVEVQLAGAVGQALAEQAVRVGDVRDVASAPAELLDVAPELQVVVATASPKSDG